MGMEVITVDPCTLHNSLPCCCTLPQKMGMEVITVDPTKMDAAGKSAMREAEIQQTDDFFHLLGWTQGATRRLLDQLLK